MSEDEIPYESDESDDIDDSDTESYLSNETISSSLNSVISHNFSRGKVPQHYEVESLNISQVDELIKKICAEMTLTIVDSQFALIKNKLTSHINIWLHPEFREIDNHPEKVRMYICIWLEVISALHNKELKGGFEHPSFDEIRSQALEYDKVLEFGDDTEVSAGVIKCPKCGSDKTRSEIRQTRSADEIGTSFFTCLICKYHGRFS